MEVNKCYGPKKNSRASNRRTRPSTQNSIKESITRGTPIKEFNLRKIKEQMGDLRPKKCLAEKLNSKLYEKYCSSQNFYYTKEIDNILCGMKSQINVKFTEDVAFCGEAERKEEMLKRYYGQLEYPKKIKLLSEYYKFHEDVPRLAMLPLSGIIHNFHDQKRRINYIKITKMLNNGKIDSEIVRNMDPNEDSEFSKGSIASSLISFLPDELKGVLQSRHNSSKKKKKNGKRHLRLKDKRDSELNIDYLRRHIRNDALLLKRGIATPKNANMEDFYLGKLSKRNKGLKGMFSEKASRSK